MTTRTLAGSHGRRAALALTAALLATLVAGGPAAATVTPGPGPEAVAMGGTANLVDGWPEGSTDVVWGKTASRTITTTPGHTLVFQVLRSTGWSEVARVTVPDHGKVTVTTPVVAQTSPIQYRLMMRAGSTTLGTTPTWTVRPVAPPLAAQRYNGELKGLLGTWAGYSNGRIPLDAMCRPSWAASHHRFRCDASAAIDAMNTAYRAEFGVNLTLNSTYRTYDQQVALKAEKGVWAATPGTSNHGWGLAVDLGGNVSDWGGRQHAWLRANANRFGWYHPRWAQFDGSLPEPWHWEYAGTVASGDPVHARALGMALARTQPWDSAAEQQCLGQHWQAVSGWRYGAVGAGDLRGIPHTPMAAVFGPTWESSADARAFLANPQLQVERGLADLTYRYRTACRALAGEVDVRLLDPSAPTSAPQGQPVVVRSRTVGNVAWRLEVHDARTNVLVAAHIGLGQETMGGVVATWKGTNLKGVPVGTGPYRLTLSGTDPATGRAITPWRTTVQVTGSQDPPTVASVPLTGDLRFVPISPARVLDTRPDAQSIGPASRVDVTVAGVAGVPADAKAVAVNITAVSASATSHIRAWPAGRTRPDASVLNVDPKRSASAAGVLLGVGGQGKVSLWNAAGSTHLVVDVTGYYTTSGGSGYGGLDQAFRALDTRASGTIGATPRTVTIAGVGGVPADARAVVLNVTSVAAPSDGYVAVVPHGAKATTSTVNHLRGADVANRTTVALAGGKVDVHVAGGRADVVVDVVGWYGPSGTTFFTPLQPVRAYDSRTANAPLAEDGTVRVPLQSAAGLPAGTTAAAVTLTATRQTAFATFLTAWPAGRTQPPTSDLNTGRGRDQANMVVVPLGGGGAVDVFNDTGETHVLLDVTGYFRPRS